MNTAKIHPDLRFMHMNGQVSIDLVTFLCCRRFPCAVQ